MATHSKLFQSARAAFFGLMVFSVAPAHAAYVAASSDMIIGDLRFNFGFNTDAQLLWTDYWYGEVRAHAADSDSSPADDYDSILGDDAYIRAEAYTAHVSSVAEYAVLDGDLVAIDPDAGVVGSTHSDLHLERPNMQADGFATSDFDNFFVLIDASDPFNQGPVDVLIEMDYSGTIFGTADQEGFFVDITHFASLLLEDALSGDLLAFDLFIDKIPPDSIPGTNTTIVHNNEGTLQIPITLNYNTEYWLFAQADSEINGYTVPTPATLQLILLGLAVMRRFRKC